MRALECRARADDERLGSAMVSTLVLVPRLARLPEGGDRGFGLLATEPGLLLAPGSLISSSPRRQHHRAAHLLAGDLPVNAGVEIAAGCGRCARRRVTRDERESGSRPPGSPRCGRRARSDRRQRHRGGAGQVSFDSRLSAEAARARERGRHCRRRALVGVQQQSGSGTRTPSIAGHTGAVANGKLRVVLLPARNNVRVGDALSVSAEVYDSLGDQLGTGQCVLIWSDRAVSDWKPTTQCIATASERSVSKAGVHRIIADADGRGGILATGRGSAAVTVGR